MRTKATILKDSLIRPNNGPDIRVTTFELVYPRIIHDEMLTHRVFSRNASSARAIPVERMINEYATFIPNAFHKNQKGMQPGESFSPDDYVEAASVWNSARNDAIDHAEALRELGVAKEITNRLLVPFMYIKVVVTGTEFDNFFGLRSHPAAQHEIKEIADAMFVEFHKSEPRIRRAHLPYCSDFSGIYCGDPGEYSFLRLKKGQDSFENTAFVDVLLDALVTSTARCARVSYDKHDGNQSIFAEDSFLFSRLVGAIPAHMSPTEHQVLSYDTYVALTKANQSIGLVDFSKLNGNLKRGLVQHRKLIELFGHEIR